MDLKVPDFFIELVKFVRAHLRNATERSYGTHKSFVTKIDADNTSDAGLISLILTPDTKQDSPKPNKSDEGCASTLA